MTLKLSEEKYQILRIYLSSRLKSDEPPSPPKYLRPPASPESILWIKELVKSLKEEQKEQY